MELITVEKTHALNRYDLKKVPVSLRGDLTKWMQEIATGVYIGNFNSKVRENFGKE